MSPQGVPSHILTILQVTSEKPIQEKPGPFTNDSLAAESVKQGGAFAQNVDNAPLDVSSSSSTLNNMDTSGASTLHSSRDAASRDPDTQGRYPESLGGQGKFPGAHVPETGYVGGSTSAKRDLGIGKEAYPASQKLHEPGPTSPSVISSSHYGGAAPSYVEPIVHNPGDTTPKGKNLREGGFDSNDRNNASWNQEIGSRKDSGRLAENKFQLMNSASGLDVTYNKQSGREEAGPAQPYGALRTQERI